MLDTFGERVTSEYQEDGILEYIFDRLPLNKYKRRYYVYIRDEHHLKKKFNLIRNLIKKYKFVNAVCHKTYPHGNIKCEMEFVKELFTGNGLLFNNPIDLLSVECIGTDFWIIKTFIEQCKHYNISSPNVIVVRYNYILGPHKSVAVPYTKTKKDNDINYTGASLKAYCNILKDYVFIGCVKFAMAGFFVRRDVIIKNKLNDDTFFQDANIDQCFSYPNVLYGMTTRWSTVERKFWISIK